MLSSLSLGKPIVTVCPQEKAGHGTVGALRAHAKESTDNAETMVAMVMLAEETDESASDVVVHGMVR